MYIKDITSLNELTLLKMYSGFTPRLLVNRGGISPSHILPTPPRQPLHIVYKFLLLWEIIQKACRLSSLWRASLISASGHRAAGWAGRQKWAYMKATKPNYLPANETLITRHISYCVAFKPPETRGSSSLHAHHAVATCRTTVWCCQS